MPGSTSCSHRSPRTSPRQRDALVRDLKAADRAEEAAEVKALRKPTVAVAAVNRVARTHADQVAALVEIGAELAALQAVARPDRDELRDLTRQRRTLLLQLTEHAAATTERPDGARSSITATLDTASLDDALRDDLQRGRLTQELSPRRASCSATTLRRRHARAPRATKRAAPPPRDELAARRARAELETARERADDAEESARARRRRHRSDRAPRGRAPSHRRPRGRPVRRPRRARRAQARRARRTACRESREHQRDRATSALHAAERAVDDSAES